jgi:hypothetical protein
MHTGMRLESVAQPPRARGSLPSLVPHDLRVMVKCQDLGVLADCPCRATTCGPSIPPLPPSSASGRMCRWGRWS